MRTTRWEYHIERLVGDSHAWPACVGELGLEGWELAAAESHIVLDDPHRLQWTGTFKRPKDS